MGNSAFGYNEVGKNASLTATTEATGLNVERIYNFTPASVWRSTAITIQRIVWDFGASQSVKFVKWINSNIKAGDTTFEFQMGTTSATSDQAVALTKAAAGLQLINSGAGWDYQFAALEIVTVAPDTYQQIGSFLLYQDYYTFVKNLRQDREAGDDVNFIEVIAENGNDFRTEPKYNRRVYSMNFDDVEAAQIAIFNDIKTNAYVTFYEGLEDKAYYGIASITIPKFASDNYQGVSVAFREVK